MRSEIKSSHSALDSVIGVGGTDSSYFSCGLLNAGLATQMAKYEEFKNSTVSLSSVTALSGKKIKITWNNMGMVRKMYKYIVQQVKMEHIQR